MPPEVTVHLDNAFTKPTPPMMVFLREDTGPPIGQVHEAVAALLEPPPVGRAALLATTMLLFAGAQVIGGASLSAIAIVVAVMFVHESGHYLAMRAFGYRNVRMFFIPFFGAAVSSPSSGSASWKEGVVLLAGPVPGIVAGVVLLASGLAGRERWLYDVASVALALNFFNLLPLGPLDGSRLLRLALFTRTRWLEVAFLAVSGAALVVVGLWLQAWLLAWVGVLAAGTVRYRYRQRAVAERLRRDHPELPRDLGDLTPEHQRVLYAYALEALPDPAIKAADAVAGAMRTLLVDITPPPSWLSSAALLLVWGVATVTALVGASITATPEESWADRACANMPVSARFPAEPAAGSGQSDTPQGQRRYDSCGADVTGAGSYDVFRYTFDRPLSREEREARFPVLGRPDAVDQMDGGRYTARLEFPEEQLWMRFVFDGPTAYQLVARGGPQLDARRFMQSLRILEPAAPGR